MAPTPIASGTLARTPLAQVLIYVERRGLSGTLAIWPDPVESTEQQAQRQDRLLILKGQLVGARFVSEAESLTDGVYGLFAREAAPYAFYEGNLLGDPARRLSGRLDLCRVVANWLRSEQVRDHVVEALLSRVAEQQAFSLVADEALERFEFDEVESGVARRLQHGPATIAQLSAQSGIEPRRARRVVYLLLLTKQIQPVALGSTPIPASADTTGIAATAIASGAVARKGAPPPPPPPPTKTDVAKAQPAQPTAAAPERGAQANATGPLGATANKPLAPPRVPPVALHAADGASAHRLSVPRPPSRKAGRPSQPSMRAPAPSLRPSFANLPAMPTELSPELQERWDGVVSMAKEIEHKNYFEMLGVAESATEPQVRAAFMKLAKIWHPDRLPRGLAAIKPQVQTIFGYFSEANSCLCDEKQRAAYQHAVKEGGGTPATDRLMQQIVDSAMQYERVLVYTRKRDYRAALGLLRQILDVTKDEPDYHAMYAWVLLQMVDDTEPPGGYQDMLMAVGRALELQPDHEKANLCKAQIYKRLGRGREALELFKKVVAINSHNVDAAREVRLAQMRGQSQPPGGSGRRDSGGLLGRWFGKR